METPFPLPAGFFDAWDQAVEGQVSEADTADFEFSVDGTGPPTHHTSVLLPAAELRRTFCFFDLRFTCHVRSP